VIIASYRYDGDIYLLHRNAKLIKVIAENRTNLSYCEFKWEIYH